MNIALAKCQRVPDRTRPHALEGLRRRDGTIDWSPWYLTEEEDMGQSGEQGQIIAVLQSSIEVLAEERATERAKEGPWSSVLVGSDNFFAWVTGEPYVQVSPDVFLLDNAPGSEGPLPRRWETWRPGHRPPRFAVEIVSSEWKKDYQLNPARYDHLGVDELVLADQEAFVRDLSARGRAPFSIYRRCDGDRLVLVYCGRGPAFCAELDAYLCFQDQPPGWPRVRISRDPQGADIIPTAMEEAVAARGEVAAARQRAATAAEEVAVVQANAEREVAAAVEKAAAAEKEVAAVQANAEREVAAAVEKAAAAEKEVAVVQANAEREVAAAVEKAAAAEKEVAAIKTAAEEDIAAVKTAADEEIAAVKTAADEEIAAVKVQTAVQAEEIALLRARLRVLGDS